MKIKSILVIGLGSIAKKHIINLKKINNKIRIFKIKIKNKKKAFNKIDKLITNFHLKSAIICSPANTHLHYINYLKKKKINYLVEKPIIKDSQLNLFTKTYDKKDYLTELVGYQLRYSHILEKIKKLLFSKTLGKIYGAKIFVNSYLPNWRKKNFKNSLSLSKKLGGGVLLELSHEIDYMLWIFGKPKYLKACIDKNKIFNKNVEEKVSIFFYYAGFELILVMSLNSRLEERNLVIEGTKASIKSDLLKKEISVIKSSKEKILFKSKQNNMNMLYEQIKFFINSVEKNQNQNNIFTSLEVIKIITQIRKSNLNNKKIKIQ